MESTPAVAQPVREPETTGQLAPLARQAWLNRLARTQPTPPAQVEMQQEAPPGQVHARQGAVNPWEATLAAGNSRPAAAGSARSPQASPADMMPGQLRFAGEKTQVPQAHSGERLREVSGEMRAVRGDIATLSRMQGYTSRVSPSYRGVLQQHEPLDSDVRLDRHRDGQGKVEGREDAALNRSDLRERELELEVQRMLAERIHRRRGELLHALRRAEGQLAQAQGSLPVGVRDTLIGEIYRARYSAAMFGGLLGGVTTGGMVNLAA